MDNENKRSVRSSVIGFLYLLLMIPVGYFFYLFIIFSSIVTFSLFLPIGILWTFVLMPITVFSVESIIFKKGINLILHGMPTKNKSK